MQKFTAHVSGKVQMAGYRSKVVIRIENTLIKVDDVKSEFSNALGAYDNFFKVAGENETDARLDVAAGHLKELIVVVKDGFKETVSKLGGMDGSLKEISQKQDEMIVEMRGGFKENNAQLREISAKQDSVIDAIDEARADVVSEVQGLRSDLKGRMEERLQRIEGDVVEIKAHMKP